MFVNQFGEQIELTNNSNNNYFGDQCINGCVYAIINQTITCNYDSNAIIDDGSCTVPGDDCELSDGTISTYNDFCECEGEILNILDYEENKNIIKVIDLLGREMKKNKGFFIEIYNDGNVNKKFKI